MIKEQYAPDGTHLPAYAFHNDDHYKAIQPKDAPKTLYSMKVNASLNKDIQATCHNRLMSGKIRFLIDEKQARSQLLSTKVGQRMSPEQRISRLMPHEMTSRLFDEMANLRLKGTGLDIVVERINARYPKDKYSSFSYGVWRIKEMEAVIQKRNLKRTGDAREFIFYTGR